MSGPLLEVRSLSTHYISARGTRVTRAVDDVSLTLAEGETLGIVGESGSGKTTLALSLLRLLPPAARIVSGEIRFEGDDLLRKSDAEMRRIRGKRIAMILQDPMASLNPLFTVGDQVAEPIRVHEGVSRGSAWRRAQELLRAVRISAPETRAREYPHQLSGGMRQRIVGAIAISCEPRLLIADEPTTSLDLTIQAQYLNLLRDLQQAHHLALIFITHNLGIVAKMCDQVAVMYAGRLVESGPVRLIYNDSTRGCLVAWDCEQEEEVTAVTIPGDPPFARGLARVGDDLWLVGSQWPLSLHLVDLGRGQIVGSYELGGVRDETVFAICPVPDEFTDPAAGDAGPPPKGKRAR